MANMQKEKTAMPQQEPQVRSHNFDEVSLGYTPEMAMNEAARCLQCKHKPCVMGCPVNIDIPAFILRIREGDFEGAYHKLKETNTLPAVCGRVCPQEEQCEKHCVRARNGEAVGIGRLERFAADYFRENCVQHVEVSPRNGHKCAVVGAGPSGLTCAGELTKRGYDVTVFEAFFTPGGVLVYGIPEFRLPKEIVKAEIDELQKAGVVIEPNVVVGKSITVDELFEEGYEAIYLATGAGLPAFLGIEGENLCGVYSANEFLTRINLMKAYKDDYMTPITHAKAVAVVGGGNVAMDAARSAKRLGAEHVYIVYRRSEAEMPARIEEIHHAKEEGIEFLTLCNPVKFIGDENFWVKKTLCVRMELGEPDESGRRRPLEVPDSTFELETDAVILSIGTSPNPLLRDTTNGLKVTDRGCIVCDKETGATDIEGVYAGGDAVTGAATVILAMGAGKKAAKAIDEYIQKKS